MGHVMGVMVQPVPWKMRLEMIVEMQIEILNGGEILVNCKTKITNWICTGRYRGIQIQSKSQFEFVPQDSDEFEFFDFNYLTNISPPFRISIGISTIIPSLIFHGTGCNRSHPKIETWSHVMGSSYGVATISRLLKMKSLFCRIQSLL